MKIADTIVAWLVLILGAIHCAFTPKASPSFDLAMLWFLSGGLLFILLAAVNLLRVRYAAVAPGLRAVCIVANLVVLAFVVAIATVLPMRQNPQVVVSIVLMVLLTVFSIARRPERA